MKPKLIRNKLDQGSPGISSDILESLADTRVSLLFLARQAKEEKKIELSKNLTAQAQTLRGEIARLRPTAHAAWTDETKAIAVHNKSAQSQLTRLIQTEAGKAKKWATAARVVSGVVNILKLTKKIL